MAETIIKFVFAGALCVSVVVVMIVAMCALIDFTRGVEESVGSLADEEREREEGGAE